MKQLEIYRGASVNVIVNASDRSEIRMALMGENRIIIETISDSIIDLNIGDYCLYQGIQYSLNRPAVYEKRKETEHRYRIEFEAPVYELLNKIIVHPTTGRTDFRITGNIDDFLNLIIGSVTPDFPGWTKGSIPSTGRINILIDNDTARSLLNKVMNEFNKEFNIVGRTINIYDRFENSTSHVFEHGRNKNLYVLKQNNVDDKATISRLIFFGGTRNLPLNYRSGMKRLISPNISGKPYIDDFSINPKVVESVVIFDDVYPSFNGSITWVSTDGLKVRCSAINFDLNSYLMPGEKPKIVFRSGDLMGRQFELYYYNHALKEVELVLHYDDYGNQYPSALFKPQIGDDFTFIDILMPAAYVTAAENALLTTAQEWFNKNKLERVSYNLDINPKYFRNVAGTLNPGDVVNIVDNEIGIDSDVRVVSVKKKFTDETDIKCEISNVLGDSWDRDIQLSLNAAKQEIIVSNDKLNAVNNSIKSYADDKFVPKGTNFLDGYFEIQTINSVETIVGLKPMVVQGDIHIGGDLYIEGVVHRWLAETLVIEDAKIQLNRSDGAGVVSSGIDIWNGATVVSSLLYDTNGYWRAGGQRLYMDNYHPDADNLGGYSAASYPRKAEAAVITGAWTFDNSIHIVGRGYSATQGAEISSELHSTNPDYKTRILFERDGSPYGTQISFWTRPNTTGDSIAQRMTISRVGFLGLNIAAPSERLHVAGNGLFEGVGLFNGGENSTPVSETVKIDRFGIIGNRGVVHITNASGGTIEFNLGVTHGSLMQLRISSAGVLIQGTSTLRGAVTAEGNVGGAGTFVGGFAGSNWLLEQANNHLTVDSLTVRGSLSVYELVVNQIRATNGALWVSDAMKTTTITLLATNSYRLSFDRDNGRIVCTFAVNDIIKAQRFDGKNVVVVVGRVTAFNNTAGTIDISTVGYTAPVGTLSNFVGLDFVRIGNTTVTNRQGALYLTSSDNNAPYLDVLDGVNTGSFAGKTKVRLGRLDGITDADLGTLSGYGLYSENVYLKGKIVANSGTIANFNIIDNYLFTGIWSNNNPIDGLGTGLVLDAPLNSVFVQRSNSNNKVELYNINDNNWGIRGRVNSTIVFELGSTNQIDGFEFGNGALGHKVSGENRFIVMSNNASDNALIAGTNSYLRRGFGYFAYDTTIGANGTKAIRMGLLSNDAGSSYSENKYGFQIIQRINSNNREIFRVDEEGAKIAGANFSNSSIWTDNWALNADGTCSFTAGTIAGANFSNSSIWTDNWALNADGTCSFKAGTIGGFNIDNDSLTSINLKIAPEKISFRNNNGAEVGQIEYSNNSGDVFRLRTPGTNDWEFPHIQLRPATNNIYMRADSINFNLNSGTGRIVLSGGRVSMSGLPTSSNDVPVGGVYRGSNGALFVRV